MSTFYDNYVRLCALNNLSESGAAKRIGLSNAAASGWKKGKMPSATTQIKLADLFGVSVEELTQDTKKERPADGEALNVDEWIKKARTMSNGDLNLALRELLKIQAERIAEDERTEH